MVDFRKGGDTSYKTLPKSDHPVPLAVTTPAPDVDTVSRGDRGAGLAGGMVAGLAAGAIASLAGALAWSLVTSLTGYKFSIATIGIGMLTGGAVAKFGGGQSQTNGIAAAALTVGGCLLGVVVMVSMIAGKELGVPASQVLSAVPFAKLLSVGFSAFDAIFLCFAVWNAYRIAGG